MHRRARPCTRADRGRKVIQTDQYASQSVARCHAFRGRSQRVAHAVRVHRRLAVPLLAAVLALSGCSAIGAPSSTPTASPTPTADLRPWASAIAEQAGALEQIRSKLSDSDCGAASSTGALCGAQLTAASFGVQTVALSIDSASTPGAKTYLGDPPVEIAATYAATKQQADDAAAAGSAWSDKCIGVLSASCIRKAGDFTTAMDDLTTKFSAWDPYR